MAGTCGVWMQQKDEVGRTLRGLVLGVLKCICFNSRRDGFDLLIPWYFLVLLIIFFLHIKKICRPMICIYMNNYIYEYKIIVILILNEFITLWNCRDYGSSIRYHLYPLIPQIFFLTINYMESGMMWKSPAMSHLGFI